MRVRLDLHTDEVNVILHALGAQPFERVHLLVTEVRGQAQAQVDARARRAAARAAASAAAKPTPKPKK